MKTLEIPLTQNKVALIDEDDADIVTPFKWYTHAKRNNGIPLFYATRKDYSTGKEKNVFMHRLIMNPPDGMVVDHINGDGLDNRKCNLRIATPSENARNTRTVRSKSGFFGVSIQPRNRKKFYAKIQLNGKTYCLGSFETAVEAAKVYDEKAKELHGDFASLNFPK